MLDSIVLDYSPHWLVSVMLDSVVLDYSPQCSVVERAQVWGQIESEFEPSLTLLLFTGNVSFAKSMELIIVL